ncbi:MAG: hypothetical protein HKN23_03625 [Verrucomicrobiales bacterium]|nr:hypothetical protein [Verrucomicrobiales bacterium]
MMNEDHNDQDGEVNAAEELEETEKSSCSDSREAFKDLGDAAKKAFRAGSHDAREALKNAVPRAKDDFQKGIHDIAYGLAYAASFGAILLKEFTPESMADGFSEGTEAGRKAADEMLEKQKARREQAESEATDLDGGEVPA